MSASTYGFNGNNPFVSILSTDNNGNLQSPAETRPVTFNNPGPLTVNCPALINNTLTVNDPAVSNGVAGGIVTNALQIMDVTPTTENGHPSYGSLYMNNGAGAPTLQLTVVDSAAPCMEFLSFNNSGQTGPTDPAGWYNLLTLKPNTLPLFTYGPVAYGLVDGTANTLDFAYGPNVSLAHTGTGLYNISFQGILIANATSTTAAIYANPANVCVSTNIRGIGYGSGPVMITTEGLPTANATGYITVNFEVVNLSRQLQDASFYFTFSSGNY